MSTAAHQIERINLRRRRAEVLLYEILRVVDDYVCDHGEHDLHRECANKLYELFCQHGAEIITDQMRADCGLPPRGPDGWTVEEMIAMERRRLEVMSRPISVIIPGDQLT